MPFKSKAQRRKFAELLVKGDISAETFEEWNRETGKAKLPERVQRKVKRARTTPGGKTSRKTVTRSTSRKIKGKRAARRR